MVPVAPSAPASVVGLWGLAVLSDFRLKAKPSSVTILRSWKGMYVDAGAGSFCVVPESWAGCGESPTSPGLRSTDKRTCPRSDGHVLDRRLPKAEGPATRDRSCRPGFLACRHLNLPSSSSQKSLSWWTALSLCSPSLPS